MNDNLSGAEKRLWLTDLLATHEPSAGAPVSAPTCGHTVFSNEPGRRPALQGEEKGRILAPSVWVAFAEEPVFEQTETKSWSLDEHRLRGQTLNLFLTL